MFKLSLWQKAEEAPPQPRPPASADVGVETVNRLLEAKMNLLRATLEARVALLRAQAMACDSVQTKREIEIRADEAEFIVQKMIG